MTEKQQSVALLGAGGKMGCRIVDRIRDDTAYDLACVEPGEEGRARLGERGIEPTPEPAALDGADVVIMAVPDELIGSIAGDVVPQLDPGAMVVLLDPAAAHAGVLPDRDDVSYFVTHPCHPPLFDPDRPPEHETDWFGGQGMAEQSIVCALEHGPEEAYARGEAVARDIYAPVGTVHRVTTRQMAILEPALAESLAGACLAVIRDGMDRAVAMGVPEEAAFDFLMGHLRIDVAILFDIVAFPFSDGAQRAIADAREEIFVDDWADRIFEEDRIEESVEAIATPD